MTDLGPDTDSWISRLTTSHHTTTVSLFDLLPAVAWDHSTVYVHNANSGLTKVSYPAML